MVEHLLCKHEALSPNPSPTKNKRAGDMTQVVEHLPSMFEALGSILGTTKK
jgi:hypothetical protein